MAKKKQRAKWKTISLWAIVSLVLLFLIVLIGANLYLNRSLPKITGEITIAGLNEPVTVIRDEMGIPHIKAANEHDLYVAQGYIQAQDRLFQMDLSRRQASGRLSEVVGEAVVDKDKYFRTLGLRRAAEASANVYSNAGMEVLNAFAKGVNLYIDELRKSGKWPIEFTFLGYEPEDWSPIDSLTIGKYMAFDLGGHWQDQAFRHYLLQEFPEDKAYDLFPEYPENAPYIISKNELDMSKQFANVIIPHEYNGSNNWVVSGEKSVSGKPLLADDPHLGLATPAIWYQMQLETKDLNVSGVIFAGVPGIILGHNEDIAWGVTNTGPDVQDLYIEKRNPDNPKEFLYNNKWEKAEIISEPIKIKDKQTLEYEVLITRHGPIISEFAEDIGASTVLSLQWTALQPSAELEAILNMNKAKDWPEFEKALQQFETPAQNFVFAAQDGTIAFKANGKIPIRKKDNGLLPVPGWTDEYDWIGYIPFEELPKTVNPKEGFISTANNKVINDDYPYHISHDWAQPYRQMRIQEVLQANDKLTVVDMMNLQMDEKNLQAEEFVPKFIGLLENINGDREKAVLEKLTNWDFYDHKEDAAPYIFNIWMGKISDVLLSEEINEEMLELFSGRKAAVDKLLRSAIEGNPGPWIEEKGGIEAVLTESLQLTLSQIEEAEGKDMSKWQWGNYHQVQFKHPLSSVFPLHYVFNRKGSIPVGGSSVTVKAAAYLDTGIVDHGASWRFAIDMANTDEAYHLVGPGQSGHVKSKWYHDQMDDWVKGTYHKTELKQPVGKKLMLMPLDKD